MNTDARTKDEGADVEAQRAERLAQLAAKYAEIDSLPVGPVLDMRLAEWLGWDELVEHEALGAVGRPPRWYKGPRFEGRDLAKVPQFSTDTSALAAHAMVPLTPFITMFSSVQHQSYQKPPGWTGDSLSDHMKMEVSTTFILEGRPSRTAHVKDTSYPASICRALLRMEPVLPGPRQEGTHG